MGESIDNAFSIIVSDTGVGISQESISSVFERFYKVNTVNADSHLGTGIGLALVRSLVLLQKGNVSIYSEREMVRIW
ncbi:MAG: ATP-binding protein [Bacteroides sp.]|nr:ATP-binding protein [Bacteroides sp.]